MCKRRIVYSLDEKLILKSSSVHKNHGFYPLYLLTTNGYFSISISLLFKS